MPLLLYLYMGVLALRSDALAMTDRAAEQEIRRAVIAGAFNAYHNDVLACGVEQVNVEFFIDHTVERVEDWLKRRDDELARLQTEHENDLRFFGAERTHSGELKINMPKYHAVHRCDIHRKTPWRAQDLDVCVPCLKAQHEAALEDILTLTTERNVAEQLLEEAQREIERLRAQIVGPNADYEAWQRAERLREQAEAQVRALEEDRETLRVMAFGERCTCDPKIAHWCLRCRVLARPLVATSPAPAGEGELCPKCKGMHAAIGLCPRAHVAEPGTPTPAGEEGRG